jgi:hypothetical protein
MMNNEFMSWVVKGYFEGMKGKDINWAKVIACITREKAWKESTKKMQKTSIKLELLKLNGGEVSCKFEGDVLMLRGSM